MLGMPHTKIRYDFVLFCQKSKIILLKRRKSRETMLLMVEVAVFQKNRGGGKGLDLLSILEETQVQYLGIFVNYTCLS